MKYGKASVLRRLLGIEAYSLGANHPLLRVVMIFLIFGEESAARPVLIVVKGPDTGEEDEDAHDRSEDSAPPRAGFPAADAAGQPHHPRQRPGLRAAVCCPDHHAGLHTEDYVFPEALLQKGTAVWNAVIRF